MAGVITDLEKMLEKWNTDVLLFMWLWEFGGSKHLPFKNGQRKWSPGVISREVLKLSHLELQKLNYWLVCLGMVTESNFEEKRAGRKEMIKALWSYTQWSNTCELKGNRHLYLPGPWMSLSQQDWKLAESMEDAAVIGCCFKTAKVVQ